MIRGKWTQAEHEDRLRLVGPIARAAYEIQGKRLPDDFSEIVKVWEIAFDGVATQHLTDLKNVGLAKKCTSAREFETVWHASVIAKHDEMRQRERVKEISNRLQVPHIESDWAKASREKWEKRSGVLVG
jgi:hypothetical protein